MLPIGPFFAIVRLSAIEAIRRPVFLLVSYSTLAGIVLLPLLLNYTLGDSARIIRDSALAFYLVGGLLLGTHAAGEGLSRELRRGTAATVLSKPVSRTLFFLAKTIGAWMALGGYSIAAGAAMLLAVRAGASDLRLDGAAVLPALAALLLAPALAGAWNHRTRRPFTSAAFFLLLGLMLVAVVISSLFPTPLDRLVFPHQFAWPSLTVGLLLYLCLGMAASLAAALATRLPVNSALLTVAALFVMGLFADFFLGPHLEGSWLARTAYAVIPNVQAFWLVDALDLTGGVPPVYLALATGYALAWSSAAVALGAASFHHLEIS